MPDLSLPDVDPSTVFSAEYLERSDRYARFNRVNWVLATLVQLAVLVVCVRLAPRFRVRGIPGGVALGLGTLVAVWVAGLPFVLAGHWWRRRTWIYPFRRGPVRVMDHIFRPRKLWRVFMPINPRTVLRVNEFRLRGQSAIKYVWKNT